MKKIILAAALIVTTAATASPISKCKACHSLDHKVKMCTGFADIYGEKQTVYDAADDEEFETWTWDEEHLRKWMCDSKKAIKEFTHNDDAKTKMPKMNVCDEKDQDEIIATLKALKAPFKMGEMREIRGQ